MSEMPPPQSGPEAARNPKADAKAAAAYAKASRPWYKKKRWWAVGAFVLIIMISAASGGGDSEDPVAEDTTSEGSNKSKGSKESAEPEPKPEPEAKPIPVQAGVMVKEFEENELAADAKYKGKALKITGVVDKIDTEMFDDEKYVLRMGGGGDFEFLTVNCYDMSTEELSTLNKGDTTTVIGEFDDGGDLGVEVNDCALA